MMVRAADAGPSIFRHAAVWSLRALLAVVVLGTFAATPPDAPRLTLGLEVGRGALHGDFTSVGWLGAALTAMLHDASGFGALTGFCGLTIVVALALVEMRARTRAGEVLSLVAAVVAAFAFLDFMHVGAGGATWACAAALVFVLDRATGYRILLAIPIAVVWCNVSPDGVLAAPLATLVALGRTFEGGLRSRRTQIAWLAAAGCTLAMLATPLVAAYPAAALEAARFDRDLLGIVALNPRDVAPMGYRSAFLAIVLFFGVAGVRGRRIEDTLLLVFAVALTFVNGAALPLLAIVGVPVMAYTLSKVAPQFYAPPSRRGGWTDALIAGVAIVLAFGFAAGSNTKVRAPWPERVSPAALIAEAAAGGRSHRLFCATIEWCDYALSYPNLSAFADGRLERLTLAGRDAQRSVMRARAGWKATLAAAHVDTILARRGDALSSLLSLDPGWDLADADAAAVLYVRSGASR